MAQRRERPAQQHGGKAFDFRLSDGRTISVPMRDDAPATVDSCCFCGEAIGGGEPVSVVVRWVEAGEQHSQEWSAHRACVAGRMHESVRSSGPFFDRSSK